jgi:hypothetical protein
MECVVLNGGIRDTLGGSSNDTLEEDAMKGINDGCSSLGVTFTSSATVTGTPTTR